MFSELLQLAVSNLGRARARLIMTAGGVVVGTSAVILLIALTFGLQRAAETSIGNDSALTQIDVYEMWGETGSISPKLNDETIRKLWEIPGVKLVIPRVYLQSSELRAGDYFGYGSIAGIDPRLLPYMGLTVQRCELSFDSGLAIVGSAIGQNFYDPNAEEWQALNLDLMQESPLKLVMGNYTTGATRKVDLPISAVLSENMAHDYMIYLPVEQVKSWNEWISMTPKPLSTLM